MMPISFFIVNTFSFPNDNQLCKRKQRFKSFYWWDNHICRRSIQKCLQEREKSVFARSSKLEAFLKSLTLIMNLQTLSHYSYHSTNRKLLFCDLQGGIYKNGFIITDPVIMSTTEDYGPTDLAEGISTFFARHKCNKFCNKQRVMPHDKKVYFKVQKGSAMALPTRGSINWKWSECWCWFWICFNCFYSEHIKQQFHPK